MLILMILLATASGSALIAQIRKDGLGSRPAPRSHHDGLDPHYLAR